MQQTLYLTIPKIWDQLPDLFGERWLQIESELWELLRRFEAEEPDAESLIVELIATCPTALDLLKGATESLDVPLKKSAYPAGTSELERRVEVPVMYGTDRVRKGNGYGGEPNDGRLCLGIARVSIPDDHRMGRLEHPPWWKLGFGWDPDQHVKLLSIDELEHQAFVTKTRKLLEMGGANEAFMFVHGFNVSFDEAACRTAQLAYDLRFKGIPMLYSWPSMGRLGKKFYGFDADKVIWTRPRLQQFITLACTQLGVTGVHLIAHSMGNRALTEVLKDLVHELPETSAPIRQVVFAAPDINVETFKDLAAKFHAKPERCTLYASANDLALNYSKEINNSVRAGLAGAHLSLITGVDTVDVSAVDLSFVGHSFYGDNTTVITDLDVLVNLGHSPDERPRLDSKGSGAKRYWVFRP